MYSKANNILQRCRLIEVSHLLFAALVFAIAVFSTALQAAEENPLAADFSLKDANGQVHSLADYKGKPLILHFWATWCPPCRKEMPAFIELQEKYKDKKFTIIGIALDDKQSVIEFTDPMGMNYPILLGDQEGMPLTTAYGNRLGVLPFTVIVDRHGNIVHRKRSELTFEQAEAMIKPLL